MKRVNQITNEMTANYFNPELSDDELNKDIDQALNEMTLREKLEAITKEKALWNTNMLNAVRCSFNDLPKRFYMNDLIKRYFNYHDVSKPMPMHDTIRRFASELRSRGIINYKCINNLQSLYEKI